MIYLTSDLHFWHAKIIQYVNRPYTSVEEMNEKLIVNWNARVKSGDQVYVIGDFSFGKLEETNKIFNRLAGSKYLVAGNHDDMTMNRQLGWGWIKDMYELKVDKQYYQLLHYPMRTWNKSVHGSRHFHGHTHSTAKPWGFSCDVGVDAWNFAPVSLDELETFMATRPRFDPEFQNTLMPKGELWQGRGHDYSYREFFVGDGSLDNTEPS